MATKIISLNKSALVNLGDYQNEKVEIGITYEVEPGETVEEAHAKVADQCRLLLARELEPVLNGMPGWRAKPWRDLLGIAEPASESRPVEPDEDDSGDDDEDLPDDAL